MAPGWRGRGAPGVGAQAGRGGSPVGRSRPTDGPRRAVFVPDAARYRRPVPPARPDGVRLFVALEPPATVREALAAWVREQRAIRPLVRPVAVEDLHLTMAFLGARPPHELARVADVVATVGAVRTCRGLSLGAPLWLPPRRPRALTIEVHDDRGELGALSSALDDALGTAIGWRPDRPLRPHVTVGRRDAGLPLPDRPLAPTPAHDFAAEALTLVRSELRPDGARYSVVERAVLED